MKIVVIPLLTIVVLSAGCHCMPSKPPQSVGSPRFDLIGERDENRYKLNPTWSGQTTKECLLETDICNRRPPVDLGCTTHIDSIDTAPLSFKRWLPPSVWPEASCFVTSQGIPGHLNLDVARFEGILGWEGMAFDGDYDFVLTPRQGGVTVSDRRPDGTYKMGIEFSSLETFNQAVDLPPWWNKLKSRALKSRQTEPVDMLLSGENRGEPPFAIVIGLLGFDCVHGCHTELHPVYALAVRLSEEPDSEHWAIMIRNWGDEGWCSLNEHPLLDQGASGKDGKIRSPMAQTQLILTLPNREALAVETKKSNFKSYFARKWDFNVFHRNSGSPKIFEPYLVPGVGADLKIDLPDPSTHTLIVGEIEISWTPKKARKSPSYSLCKASDASAPAVSTNGEDPESRFESALSGVSDAQWERYRSALIEASDHLSSATNLPLLEGGKNAVRPYADYSVKIKQKRGKAANDKYLFNALCGTSGILAGTPACSATPIRLTPQPKSEPGSLIDKMPTTDRKLPQTLPFLVAQWPGALPDPRLVAISKETVPQSSDTLAAPLEVPSKTGAGRTPARQMNPEAIRRGSFYLIKKGDNLSTIAQRAYGHQVWQRIYRANRGRIRNPNLIFPGKNIFITRK